MNFIATFAQWLFHSYEEFCELNLTYFKMFGLFQMVNPYNRVSRTSQNLWLCFHTAITLFTSIHTIFQVISLFVSGADYKNISNTVTHIGNWTIAAVKFVDFVYNRRRLQFLFDIFRIDFLHITNMKEKKEILFNCAYTCNWFILVYVISCLVTCCVWNVYPLAELIYYSLLHRGNSTYQPKNILDSWYPFDSTKIPVFYYIYVYEFLIYFYMLFAFCCYDSFLFSMFTMMTGQFDVLHESFSDIGHNRPIKEHAVNNFNLFRSDGTLFDKQEDLFVLTEKKCSSNNLTSLKLEQLLDAPSKQQCKHMEGKVSSILSV